MAYYKYAAKRHKPLIEDFLKMYVKKKYRITYIQRVLAQKHGYEFNSARMIINGPKAERILAEREKKKNLKENNLPTTSTPQSSPHESLKPANRKN